MFLARSVIHKRQQERAIFVDGTFGNECVQQCSYDLRLGQEVYIVGDDAPRKLTERKPYLVLPPGQFAILTTYEKLWLPEDLMAFITLRNRYKLQGLINITGFHVDPTFKGVLLFGVQNVGPTDIRLKFRERTFTIFFSQVDGDAGEARTTTLEGIRLEDIEKLGGSSITLSQLKKEIESLRTLLLIYAPIAIALLLALTAALFKKGS